MQSPISNDLEVSLFEMEQYLRNSIGYLRRDRDTHACRLSTCRRLEKFIPEIFRIQNN